MKHQFVKEKAKLHSEEKILAFVFLYYRVRQTSGNNEGP